MKLTGWLLGAMLALLGMNSWAACERDNAGTWSSQKDLNQLWSQGRHRDVLGTTDPLQTNTPALALRRGIAALSLGEFDTAEAALSEAEAGADSLSAAGRVALGLATGNLAGQLGDAQKQLSSYRSARALADEAGDDVASLQATLNEIRALVDDKELLGLSEAMDAARAKLDTIPAGDQKAALSVGYVSMLVRAIEELAYPEDLLEGAQALLTAADGQTTEPATSGYVKGYLGHLMERDGDLAQALDATNRAVFAALDAGDDAQRYRWEWQTGRILATQGNLKDAEAAYGRAVSTLSDVEGELALGTKGLFERAVQPVYTQYADILLRRIGQQPSGDAKQERLSQVRGILEALKRAEVEDYFADQCLLSNEAPQVAEAPATGAAVIYPVFLDERIELVVEANGRFAQYTTPVGRAEAFRKIRQLRINLERNTSGTDYLEPAQQLHQWLIAPLSSFLREEDVHTLVIVPEGQLRTVPLAALHDGQQFLVQQYAVSTTPGVDLVRRQKRADKDGELLIGGLSESVQGFAGLPSVEQEIETVTSLFEGTTMRNQTFQRDTVSAELTRDNYSIAHFATHGEFSSDYRKSFILTYDDRFTLDSLRSVLGERGDAPLDLLVLSACKTAAGDDRAALGLAGVAVQSGAESAVASLWYISDRAASELVTNFYEQVQSGGHTKAESLRLAQLSLIDQSRFEHPSFWAPFLLIGDWQ